MTKSTITREESVQAVFDLKVGYRLGFADLEILKRVARMALAAMDSEPVAIIDQANLDYLRRGADADVWPPEREEMGDVLLYRHAQPELVVPELRVDWQENEFSAGWNAYRAAMLAAAPHDTPALNSVQSVVTVPGKWIPVSERMPDDDDFVYIWPRPDFGVELHVGQYCECSPKGDGWYAQVYEQNYGIEWHPITVTHWMPLPAGPKEDINALIPLVSRNEQEGK